MQMVLVGYGSKFVQFVAPVAKVIGKTVTDPTTLISTPSNPEENFSINF